MNFTGILTATVCVAAVGLFVGIFLGIAGIAFKTKVNEKEEAVLKALPGNNCGGCGYPGCSGLAAAIANGEAPVNQCPVGGDVVALKIAGIMGVNAQTSEKLSAFVKCSGDCEAASNRYEYTGVRDCVKMAFIPGGGSKACEFGCLGYGSCVKACEFDAIHIVNGVAKVDPTKCKACGKCVTTCPKGLIELIPYDSQYAVACSSKEKGPEVMKKCKNGCIGCGICTKQCENDAVHVEDYLARIDQYKCISCGKCAEKCPKKVINNIK